MRLINQKRTQAGITLIELMIGMIVGLIVIAGILTVYSNNVRAQVTNIKMIRVNQELNSLVSFMVNDLRRAGFVTEDVDNASLPVLASSPFRMIRTLRYGTQSAGNTCILYAYNKDKDHPIDHDPDEFFGFALDNGRLLVRVSGDTLSDCANKGGNDRWCRNAY